MKKQERAIYIVIIIILVGILSAASTYIIMNNKNNKQNNNSNTNNKEPIENNDKKNNEEKITLSNTELNKYLSYTLDLGDTIGPDNTIVNINTADKALILGNALYQIKESEYIKKQEQSASNYVYVDGDGYYYHVSEAKIESLLKKMYNLELKDFNLKENSNKYVATAGGICYLYVKQGFTPLECSGSEGKLSKIDSYEANDQELVIYEYAVGLDAGNNINDYYTQKIINIDDDDNYFDKHYKEFTKYKHTFKKNDTGYYWYQTEVVK